MSVLVALHNAGDATIRREVQAVVEHILSGWTGEWRVSIVGSRAKEDWELKVEGPNGFERSYTLVGSAGEHQPVAIGNLLLRLLPSKISEAATLAQYRFVGHHSQNGTPSTSEFHLQSAARVIIFRLALKAHLTPLACRASATPGSGCLAKRSSCSIRPVLCPENVC